VTDNQRRVLVGMITAAVFSFAFIVLAYLYLPLKLSAMTSVGERLSFALRCDLLAVLMLLLGIGVVARQRFFSTDAIDGSFADRGSSLDINVRYVQNTTEQCLLLIVGHLVLATVVSEVGLKMIPILVALFVFARLCFWIGYHRSPISRAFGFAATFYPTVGVLLYDAYRVLL